VADGASGTGVADSMGLADGAGGTGEFPAPGAVQRVAEVCVAVEAGDVNAVG
jgi:hypothetical protein